MKLFLFALQIIEECENRDRVTQTLDCAKVFLLSVKYLQMSKYIVFILTGHIDRVQGK